MLQNILLVNTNLEELDLVRMKAEMSLSTERYWPVQGGECGPEEQR